MIKMRPTVDPDPADNGKGGFTITDLLEEARAAGLVCLVADGRLHVRGPRAATDLAQLLVSRKREVIAALNGARCCGRRSPGIAAEPLVNACQLCPTSPTYWRGT